MLALVLITGVLRLYLVAAAPAALWAMVGLVSQRRVSALFAGAAFDHLRIITVSWRRLRWIGFTTSGSGSLCFLCCVVSAGTTDDPAFPCAVCRWVYLMNPCVLHQHRFPPVKEAWMRLLFLPLFTPDAAYADHDFVGLISEAYQQF